ncbi:glycosyltransferase [Desulforhopalus singaporensis]|uniref:Glycosyltransferase, catalytic subunit of cellulose synthase and poly-beta-1,6-N-acetylglucosamine synthase n=1 Tax=Desulforhopalus singaporensis TaxID=91360 RepID=A0A1H0TM31_9BACT|nr:glycosyltransferase [Desulforhopalus singaporensis]SDP55033.1 Glycosyltransferase, catalytic subunit of cellulose synthase and poly-beta-1,6-N-acetylglucosamine synthase [Desulforhopalus singaporensis]
MNGSELSLFSVALAAFSCGLFLWSGSTNMRRLGDHGCRDSASGPKVSVVVPVCNEEENVEQGLRSLLDQDYENLEIIVVNDRSEDRTAEILARMQATRPGFSTVTIHDLPDKWIGKSHALWTGAKRASGTVLLFTDGDVQLEPTAVTRAVSYMEKKKLDHLCLTFKNISKGWLLNSMIVEMTIGLFLLFRPWSVSRRDSSAFMGVGAFNMIRGCVYREIGGHKRIRMHPIDDVMLGKIVKRAGYRQDCLIGDHFVLVPWYRSVREMCRGLEKNVFALAHYRVWLTALVLMLIGCIALVPVLLVTAENSELLFVCSIITGTRLVIFYKALRMQLLPRWYLAGALVTPFISFYIVAGSMIVTLRAKGIVWRTRHYPLHLLKESEPLLF